MAKVVKQRYAVIGAGALGGLYGGLLAKAGFEVHFLMHSDYDHVREHGLKVESILGDFHLSDVHVHASADSMPACDVTLLGLKTTSNHLLADLLPSPTRDGGVVFCLQNGLDVERDSAAIVGPDRVLGGCCFLCSNKVGPGHIRHLDQGRIVFGPWNDQANGDASTASFGLAETICGDLVQAGIDAKTTRDLNSARWRKLMWNIPFNGLSVVFEASTSEIMADPSAVELTRQLIAEVRQAGLACGAEISTEMAQQTITVTEKMKPYDSSMRLDYVAKRPIEIDAIFARPIDRAERAGSPMPAVSVLRRQLEFLDRRNRG